MFRKSQIIFISTISFIIGVAISSFFNLPWLFLYPAFIISILLIMISKKRTTLRAVGWSIIFLIIGIIRYQLSIPQINENHLAYYNDQNIVFQGIVGDEPDARKDKVNLIVKAEKIKAENQFKKISGRVLVSAGLFPQYNYGDLLEIKCQLKKPEPIEDFQYDKYLAKSDIYSVCYKGQIKLIEADQGNFFKALVLKVKNKVIETVSLILPEPQAAFLGGLLWGAKKGLPEDILTDFNRAGVTHIIAVSGYNISIIAVMLSNLFINLGLNRKKAFWLIVSAIIFFVIITGSPPSIVRAGVMGMVALIASSVGRAVKMHNMLAIVALIMLLFNPKILIWDAGFQLSFLATVGLVYFSPIMEKYTGWLPSIFQIRESLTTTLSAIVLTMPLMIYQFGRFSMIAPIANLLILPAIPVNMAVGFLAVTAGLIYLPFGQIIGYGSWLLLTYVLKVIEFLADLKFSSIVIEFFPWWLMASGYIFIGFLIINYQRKLDE